MADSYKSSRRASPARTPKSSQISGRPLKFYQKPRGTDAERTPTPLHFPIDSQTSSTKFFTSPAQGFGSSKQRFILPVDSDSSPFAVFRKGNARQKEKKEQEKREWESGYSLGSRRFLADALSHTTKSFFGGAKDDSSRQGRKIREEAAQSGHSGFSVGANLNYVGGNQQSNSKSRARPCKQYFFDREMVHKKGSRKIVTRRLEVAGFSSTSKDPNFCSAKAFLSTGKVSEGISQTRKTKPVHKRRSGHGPREPRRLKQLVGFKTIENFGGMANFCLKNRGAKGRFLTKKHSALLRRNQSRRDRQPERRNLESDPRKKRERGSSSVKARNGPREWFAGKEKLYYSKKSHFFENADEGPRAKAREREVVQMFLEGRRPGRESKTSAQEWSLMQKIRSKCQKIVQEPKSKNASRGKLSQLRSGSKQFEIRSLGEGTAPHKRSFQNPPITSIDPVYIHAFMLKKKKRSKVKKGVSFFMAKFCSRRTEKSFYVFEKESEVVKFRRNQRNKIIEHTADDDFDTDDEQMKLAVRQCKSDFLKALRKARDERQKRKRATSMVNLTRKRRPGGLMGEQLLKLHKLHETGKKSSFQRESPLSRRQTRKARVGGLRKGESIRSLASTVASSLRNTHKPGRSKERRHKMIRNEFYRAGRGPRRALSIMPKRSRQKSEYYKLFDKGARKRNKVGF